MAAPFLLMRIRLATTGRAAQKVRRWSASTGVYGLSIEAQRRNSSLLTRRWRERDSNHRSRTPRSIFQRPPHGASSGFPAAGKSARARHRDRPERRHLPRYRMFESRSLGSAAPRSTRSVSSPSAAMATIRSFRRASRPRRRSLASVLKRGKICGISSPLFFTCDPLERAKLIPARNLGSCRRIA